MNRRLYRSRTDSVIGGVAGGVAEYLDVDPSIVRIVWAVLAIVTGGIFLVLYIVMWIVVPEGTQGPVGSYQPGPGAVPGWTPPEGTAASTSAAPEGADASAMPAAEGTGETASTDTQATPTWSAAAPTGGYAAPEHHRRGGAGASMIFGLLLVLLGAWFLIDEYVPGLDSDLLWPIALVVIGLALLFISMRRSSEG
jgi:phage shock protein PspC (stress-responsive transcriptional regulator)